jgi:hypothetical protein
MRLLKSQALGILNKAIGLSGGSGVGGETQLDDDNVSQVLATNDIIRRSLTLAGSDGIFLAITQNTHGAGSSTQTSQIEVNRPQGLAHAPYPAIIPDGLEVWVLGVCGFLVSGTSSNFTDCTCHIQMPSVSQGMSSNQSGAQLGAVSTNLPIAFFDNIQAGSFDAAQLEDGGIYYPIKIRVRRGSVIQFRSNATNAVVVQMNWLCGLFPIGLGQDVTF